MFALDLFNTDHERRLAEGAVDRLEQRRIDDLAMKMDDLVARAKEADTPDAKAALVKEFQKCKAERDSYFKIKDECMGYGGIVGEAGIGQDLVTPQQRVKQSQPQKQTPVGKVVDTARQAAKWLAGKGGPGKEGPTYEDKKQKKKFRDPEVSNELRKIRASYPSVGSDLEAVAKRDLETDQEQDKAIQSLSVLAKDLESELSNLKQNKPADLKPMTPVAAPSAPGATISARPTATAPATPAITAVTPSIDEPAPAVTAKPGQVAQPTTVKPVSKAKRTAKFVPKTVEPTGDQQADTKVQIPTGATSAPQTDNVIDIRSKLGGAGLPSMPEKRYGTYGESISEQDAESPVIGSMVQQLQKPNILQQNIKAFRDAYEATRSVKLNYGGSANIPLTFATMDGIVSVMTNFPKDQQEEIWNQMLSDPNYLQGFLKEYVPQKGLLEADVINLAQQRQSPDQLKAYSRALEILQAAKNPSIPSERVNMLKQALFKDFGARIQRAPDGHYYISYQGKQINLPNPTSAYIEEGQRLHQGDPVVVTAPNEFEGKTGEIYDFSPSGSFVIVDLYNHGKHSMHLSDIEYNQYADDQNEEDDWYDEMDESAMGELDAMRQDLERMNDRQFLSAYGTSKQAFQQKYRTVLNPAQAQDTPVLDRTRFEKHTPKKNEFNIGEGFQDFNKVEPYEVCLAGKPVKRFDYYEQARRFHDNWKQKLYREGNKEKADKITLNPILDEDNRSPERVAADKLKAAEQTAKFIMRNLDDRHALKQYAPNTWSPERFYQGATAAMRGADFDEIVKIVYQDEPAWFPKPQYEAKDGDINFGHTVTKGSWIVHNDGKKPMRFKTHTGAKAYAEKNGGKVYSSEFYADKIQGVKEAETDYSKRRQRERDVDAGKPVAKQRQPKMTDYQKKRAQDKKDMELGEESSTSSEAVEIALIRRILVAHTDLIMEFGLDKVTQAIEEVAYNVGDVDEIGTSDVSAYVAQVKQILGAPEELDEKWSQKYKSSINCSNPKGFSQRAHCAGRKK